MTTRPEQAGICVPAAASGQIHLRPPPYTNLHPPSHTQHIQHIRGRSQVGAPGPVHQCNQFLLRRCAPRYRAATRLAMAPFNTWGGFPHHQPIPPKRLGLIFSRAAGRSKIFSCAFGAKHLDQISSLAPPGGGGVDPAPNPRAAPWGGGRLDASPTPLKGALK